MKKLKQQKGMAWLIFLLILAILIMLVIILIPVVQHMNEAHGQDMDTRNEQTAEDSALMKVVADGPFEAIYDKVNKKWVPLGERKEVPTYGESEAHKGMVLYVRADEDMSIHMTWIDPDQDEAYE